MKESPVCQIRVKSYYQKEYQKPKTFETKNPDMLF